VILDVAHNKDGIREVLNNIDFYYPDRQIHFILGFVKDKHLQPILDILPSTGKYYFTEAHIARALPRESLKSNAYLFHLQGEAYEDVNIALEAAKSQASKEDVIIITGSFFIISELAPDVLAR
jgi:dihydrofolate synthase/folylpolyglutamate synthase